MSKETSEIVGVAITALANVLDGDSGQRCFKCKALLSKPDRENSERSKKIISLFTPFNIIAALGSISYR